MKIPRYLFLLLFMLQAVSLFAGTMSSSTINFGTITLMTTAGGTARISETGQVTTTGNVSMAGAARGWARYHLTGDNCKCTLSFSGLPSTLNLTGPGTLQLTNFSYALADFDTGGSCTSSWVEYTYNPAIGYWFSTLYGTYYIGATANITSATQPGTYTGSFTINSSGNTRGSAAIGSNRCQLGSGSTPAENLSVTVNVTVNVVWPLSVSSTQNLNFAKIMKPASACNVSISASGVLGGSCVIGSDSTKSSGRFQVTGVGGANVTVGVSNATLTGPGANMTVSNYVFDKATTHALDASGLSTVNFGGTLALNANQAAGVYSGSYTITVNYQ